MINPYPNTNPLSELGRFFRQRSALSNLILINIAVWLGVKIVQVIFFLYNQPNHAIADNLIMQYLGLPASLPALFQKPWTLITYMFLHIDFWHIFFNLLWLFWFGKIFLEYLSSRQLLWTYLLGGLAGGICYVAAFNFFPVFQNALPISLALGASAAVMAIVTAISFYVPNYSINILFIGRVKIIYLAIILFIFDFFSISSGNSGGHIAHIGGVIYGFAYGYIYLRSWKNRVRKIRKIRSPFSEKIRSFFTRKPQPKETYSTRPKSDDEYNREKKENQKRIDSILEKISKGGYDSLTHEEKEFLFKSSQNNH
ncbi:MAG: rhomboid family intramembrane serine protease [Bacteroidota bacterium]|nr:rhomboid family intramembrane serine protease [Bacteroidota bacterium]